MFAFVVTVHIIVCVLLVLSVLLQQGKGAEIGAVFGSSEALFGTTGPTTFLHKLVSGLAVLFMLTSLGLTYLSSHRGTGSVMEDVRVSPPPVTAPQPQVPTAPPGPGAVKPDEKSGQAPMATTETSKPSEAPAQPPGKDGKKE